MTDDTQADRSEFEQAMTGVTRITSDRIEPPRPRRATRPDANQRYRRAAAEQDTAGFVDGLSSAASEIVESEQELLFVSPGVQLRLMKRLRRGHLPWQQGLDLHGYSIDDARTELVRFVRDSVAAGLRCVLVMHGKSFTQAGQPALIKSHVNDWLRQLPEVVAFCSAQPQDGGAGALYVLLRRKPS